MSNDTAILFPNREMMVGGEAITLRPFYFGELPVVVRLLAPILASSGLPSMIKVTPGQDKKFDVKLVVPENLIENLTLALLEASEPVMDLLAFALKKDRAWFNTLAVDDGIALTEAWFEINRDFFVRRVLPRMAPLLAKFSTGSTSSPSSSAPDTEETTSTVTP